MHTQVGRDLPALLAAPLLRVDRYLQLVRELERCTHTKRNLAYLTAS